MAYRDPYAERYSGRYDQPYTDAAGFNPYNNAQPHQAYDQGGYDSYGPGGHRQDANYGQFTNPGTSTFAPGHKSESNYDRGAFARATTGKCVEEPLPEQGAEILFLHSRLRDLRHWRYEHHGALWAKVGLAAASS